MTASKTITSTRTQDPYSQQGRSSPCAAAPAPASGGPPWASDGCWPGSPHVCLEGRDTGGGRGDKRDTWLYPKRLRTVANDATHGLQLVVWPHPLPHAWRGHNQLHSITHQPRWQDLLPWQHVAHPNRDSSHMPTPHIPASTGAHSPLSVPPRPGPQRPVEPADMS